MGRNGQKKGHATDITNNNVLPFSTVMMLFLSLILTPENMDNTFFLRLSFSYPLFINMSIMKSILILSGTLITLIPPFFCKNGITNSPLSRAQDDNNGCAVEFTHNKKASEYRFIANKRLNCLINSFCTSKHSSLSTSLI